MGDCPLDSSLAPHPPAMRLPEVPPRTPVLCEHKQKSLPVLVFPSQPVLQIRKSVSREVRRLKLTQWSWFESWDDGNPGILTQPIALSPISYHGAGLFCLIESWQKQKLTTSWMCNQMLIIKPLASTTMQWDEMLGNYCTVCLSFFQPNTLFHYLKSLGEK